jgi:dolichol-phosphate mannosyltransferase
MMKSTSLAVVMTARNEVGNLESAVDAVLSCLKACFAAYEVLIIDDGSRDGTGRVADELARRHQSVRVIHHSTSMGFALSYRHGVSLTQMAYVALVTGDNEMAPESIRAAFDVVGEADVVVPYQANQQDRPWRRRILSRAFTFTVNVLFNLRLRYFQGPCIYSTQWAQRLPLTTTGFALLTDMLVRTLKAGCTYAEVPMKVRPRAYGRSSALSLRNIATAIWVLAILCRDIYLRGKLVVTDRPNTAFGDGIASGSAGGERGKS